MFRSHEQGQQCSAAFWPHSNLGYLSVIPLAHSYTAAWWAVSQRTGLFSLSLYKPGYM